MIRMLTILVFTICSLPAVTLALDGGPPIGIPDAGATPAASDGAAPMVDAAPGVPADLANPDAPVTTDDVVDRGRDAVAATRRAISDPTLLGIMGAIAAFLWAAIAAIRRWGRVYLSGTITRWITLIAAPIATFLGAFATGVGWFEALVLAGGGPGALLLNELLRAFGTGDSSATARSTSSG